MYLLIFKGLNVYWLTPLVGGPLVGLVHLWTDQRIPGPVSCRCPGGLWETPPRWHATIVMYLADIAIHTTLQASNYLRNYNEEFPNHP